MSRMPEAQSAVDLPGQPWPVPRLAPRAADAHKGTFGTALIVGGSPGMSGAPSLAGRAALRGGAGLVRVAVPATCLSTVAGFEPAYTTMALPVDRAGRIALAAEKPIHAAVANATAVGLGPGLGRSLGLNALVARLYRDVPAPMVVDADALNALAEQPAALAAHAGPRVLTPHPGEFARLCGQKLPPHEAAEAAFELAARCGAVVVLKGHRTLVTDGQRRVENQSGNPGMATGGSGDVLTGLLTAFLCQKLEPFDAARLAVYLHGRAGDLAAERLGQISLTAGDLIEYLPAAIRELFGV